MTQQSICKCGATKYFVFPARGYCQLSLRFRHAYYDFTLFTLANDVKEIVLSYLTYNKYFAYPLNMAAAEGFFEPTLVRGHGLPIHIGRGGTDKSKVGDYENRLQYVKFGGLAI